MELGIFTLQRQTVFCILFKAEGKSDCVSLTVPEPINILNKILDYSAFLVEIDCSSIDKQWQFLFIRSNCMPVFVEVDESRPSSSLLPK